MSDKAMPFVAVIGGLWELSEGQREAAQAAGRALGEEFAKAGFGLVVYYSNQESLEPHVVAGFVAALPQGAVPHMIRVRYSQGQRGQVTFAEETIRPEVFDHLLFQGENWEAPFYRSLAENDGVDAVLLLGGANSTLIAGQIAAARQLPILAIDTFGGAAQKIHEQLAITAGDGRLSAWNSRKPVDFVKELAARCAEVAGQRKQAALDAARLARLNDRRLQVGYATAAFAALLTSLVLGPLYTPFPRAYTVVLIAGLIAAGATGALVRGILSTARQSDPHTSLLLGAIAGFVVGIAYLIPQFVGAPGVLDIKGDAISPTDKIQFFSAALVALSAGIGFDTVFHRMVEEAKTLPVAPPS